MKQKNESKRLFYLDNLKVMLIALVVLHHASSPYSEHSSWPYVLSNTDDLMPWIWHLNSSNAAFFMGLFFMISGYFIPASFDSQGVKVFIRKKLMRLGVPLLIVSLLLSIATGQLEVGHLWFLENLLLFCLLYALCRIVFGKADSQCDSKPSVAGMLAVATLMGIGGYFIRIVSPQDNWIWLCGFIHIEPAHILQYAMMFTTGVLAGRFDWFRKMSDRTGLAALSAGVALLIGNYLRGGIWNEFVTKWFGIYESFLCVFLCFGLIWFFREKCEWSGGFWKWCGSQAYGAYVIHLPLLLGIQYATDGLSMPPVIKLSAVTLVTIAVSFSLTWLLKMIPGVRKVI